jgi:hypothetical protein
MTLRVTIEVVPNGDESRARKIGTVTFDNLSDLAPTSDYRVTAQHFLEGRRVEFETIRVGLFGFKRVRGWAHLLVEALTEILRIDKEFALFPEGAEADPKNG